MQVATGKVIAGRVVVDGLALVEGERVMVVSGVSGVSGVAETGAMLTSEDEGELLEAMAEADRGDTISADELFARLRQTV